MKTSRRVLGLATVSASLLALATMAACSNNDQSTPCPTRPKPGLAIAVGGRANSPSPAVPVEVQQAIDEAVDDHSGITVVRVDGRPTVACALAFSSDSVNPIAKADDERRFRELVNSVVGATRAKEAEADPLAALSQAAAAADTNGTVVLIDSGLQTVPPLNFREPGLIDADPDAVVDQLAAQGRLPDLRRRSVILAGIGYTANPQKGLDERRRVHLVQMWQKIAARAGAMSVVTVESPNTAGAVGGVPRVSTVNVPAVANVEIGCNTETVFSNDGKVGFVPGTTTFIDPGAARETLTAYANWLMANPSAHAGLVGTIAHYGTDEGDGGLARARAERVRTELLTLGAGQSQVSAHGDGWGPFPSKDAPPSDAYDQRNRRVVLTITCG